MRDSAFRFLVAPALVASLAAQQTIVIDASGGGHYTDLPPAVAAANDGDILLVRRGTYTGFVLDGKGLVVLGDTGAVVGAGSGNVAFTIRNLPAASDVVLSGLVAPAVAQCVAAAECAGRIHLQHVTGGAPPTTPWAATFVRCASVSAHACAFAATIQAIQTNLALNESSCTGMVGASGSPFAAVEVFAESGEGSLVSISDSAVTGATGTLRGAPAIFVYSPMSSRLAVAGSGTVLTAGAGAHVIEASIAASVWYSANVTFVPSGSVSIFGGLAEARERPLSSARVAAAAPGQGDVVVDFEARAGDLLVAFTALPSVPIPSPVPDTGQVWLDSLTTHEIFSVPVSGVVSRSYPVPANPTLLGRAITMQGLSGTLSPFDLVMGVPATFVLH